MLHDHLIYAKMIVPIWQTCGHNRVRNRNKPMRPLSLPKQPDNGGMQVKPIAYHFTVDVRLQRRADDGGAVLVKGGHRSEDADDLLWRQGQAHWYRASRVDNPNNHGSGCTLSSAIASFLALGDDLPRAVGRAKAYITACMEAGLDLGAGSGPLKHNYAIKEGGSVQ